ncbi:MAG: acyl carrier protein [Phycisphaera sp.]|nr:acyl carrier protein [Phycisphaera sp.]
MPTHEEVFEQVREVLVDALGVDDDEVTADATLTGDLGAESIDFLDIVFRLEKAFSIKINQEELFPQNVLQDEQYVQDGKVTDKGMEELRKRLPHANFDKFDADRDVNNFGEVFTVEAVTKFVESKL